MLAAAVELRNLADTVSRRAFTVWRGYLIEFSELMIPIEKRRSLSLRMLARMLVLRLKLMPSGSVIYFLPIAWSISLLAAAAIEALSFLYLAGALLKGPWVVIFVAVISSLMILLIVTPIIQTLIVAPESGSGRVRRRMTRELYERIQRAIPDVQHFEQLSPEERRKVHDRVKSIIESDISDSTGQRQPSLVRRPASQSSIYRSKTRPKWARRKHVSRSYYYR